MNTLKKILKFIKLFIGFMLGIIFICGIASIIGLFPFAGYLLFVGVIITGTGAFYCLFS